jgi:hypothetical protein
MDSLLPVILVIQNAFISILAWLSSLDSVSGQYGGLGMITRPIWKRPCINLYLYDQICQYNIKTFIGPIHGTIVSLRDVFHIGLVIGLRPAVLVWGAAECQYSRPRTSIPLSIAEGFYLSVSYIYRGFLWPISLVVKSQANSVVLLDIPGQYGKYPYWTGFCRIGPMKVSILYWQIWSYKG